MRSSCRLVVATKDGLDETVYLPNLGFTRRRASILYGSCSDGGGKDDDNDLLLRGVVVVGFRLIFLSGSSYDLTRPV